MSKSHKGERLKVFISSKMTELRDVREIVYKTLDEKGINAWVYENDAGARPASVRTTSLEMLSTDQMSLNYRLFPERLHTLFGPAVQEQRDLDRWQYDMMGQTLFVRNLDGDYTPAHRSLLEFFIAYKLAAELGILAPDFLELAQSQTHVDPTKPAQKYTWSSYFQREVDSQGNITPIVPLRTFTPEKIERLATTLGTQPLAEVVLDLMQNMIIADKEELRALLLATIHETQSKTITEVSLIEANCIAILTHLNLSG